MSTRASETEKHTILVDFNQTKSVGEIQETVVDLIEQQAALAPSSTALIFEETEMTYQELNERANQLAHRLIELGVKEETIVGLCIHRSIEMYIGILGIMKSGGAYLPIEPTLPTGRMQYMLEDAKANIVLSNTASKDGVEELEQLTLVELNDTKIQNAPVENVELKLKPTRLAYVIYTSGSTGAPKGVMIQHNSLTNLQLVMKDALQADHTTSFLSLASYGFDMSCLELYLPLTVGGQLMLARVGLAADGYVLKELINKHKPSHMQATASTWQILIDSGWKNEEGVVIMTGGEPTSEMLKNQLVQLSTSRVLNMYGPTEATVWATMDVLTLEKKISIGKPLANYQVYILDEEDQLSAIGEIGELCIAGVGLARGYLNREALTQEKFVTSVNQDLTGTRIYRTGDLARWLPDGTIECLGRKDSQVKVRGYRIELGEIEAVFQAMSAIHSVVVLIKEGKNEAKNLVAFVVKHAEITTDELLEAAKTFLPDYMLPTFFVELDELPRNANGKIDRKALAQFDVFSMQNSIYEAPKTPIERQIVAIWEDLLGRERIGRDEHFFKLGGHSLLATRVVSALRNIYTIELTITDLFKHSTVKELAHYVESLEKKEKIVIEAAERPELVPLSFAQERLWFIDQLEGSVNYHIPYVFFINGRLDQAALAQAFQSVINRHEALRTVFKSSKGEAYQYVLAENTWELERSVVQGTSDQLERFIQQQLEKPFNLETDHMLRAHLMECSEQEHYLLVVIHHIAADGWSLPILMEELNHFYTCHKHHTASDLAPLPIQYADFALWQKARLSGEVLAKKMLYWEEKLKDIKTITLPEDFERPNKLSRAGKTLKFLLKKELSTKLYDFARQENATLFMVMLSVFKVLLHKYSNQTDICVGSGIANRTQSEIESLIGFFVNAIVIRSDLSAPLTFQELLQQIKATTLEAYHNQEVPFEKVVDRIEQNRDLSRDPLFQVLFVVQNTPGDDTLFLNELKVKEVTPSNQTSKFDLYFDITETADGLVLAIEYNADIFASSTIMRMKEQYELLLAAAIANPHRKIEQLELIDARTQKQLLESFNNTSFAYPREKHVPMLFEQQVKRNPSSVALAFGKEQLTYAQLNEKSNQVAHYLIDKGIQPEDLVGLCIERSMNTIIAIVGIVKAGAAYVPIDPEYPTERIKFMMQDVAMDMMITESKYVALFQEKVQHLLLLDEASELLEGYANSNPEIELTANQLAYVMYTSGSTGNPKGVLIEHRAIVRLIFSKEFEFLTDYSVLYQYAPITFDASTFEIWGALLKGGKLVIALPTQLSLEAIAKELQQHNVNTLWLTAGLFHSAIDSCMELFSPISYMLSGGDSIRVESIQALLTTYPEITFINGYGPTESTTFTSINRVDNVEQLVSHQNCIGKPISNTQVYILSEGGSILPVGAIGELHIGGDG
ncbi:MAG: amino acid adenylation domain-containing protein, partial [Flammeovirgaceae bacterium]